jgi:hypothetical protein
VIEQVTTNAATVGMAVTALTVGSNCAAAIKGIRKSPFLITSDVQLSGDVMPVKTESTDTTATSAASTSSVTDVRASTGERAVARSAHALQHATTTT